MLLLIVRGFVSRCSQVVAVHREANVPDEELDVSGIWLIGQTLVGDPHNSVENAHALHVVLLSAQATLQLDLEVLLELSLVLVEG